MMRIAAVALMICAQAAKAGPWPREAGEGFVSVTSEIGGVDLAEDIDDLSHFSNVYMEYGLGRSLTLGLNVGHGSTTDTDARAFLNLPVYRQQGQRVALELSIGRVGDTTYSGVGLQYGRGFEVLGRNGWIAVEGRVDQALDEGFDIGKARRSKLDLTLGVTHANGLKTMAQVFNTAIGDDIYSTFAPGLVVPVGGRFKVETGLLIDLNEARAPGLKIGLWHEF